MDSDCQDDVAIPPSPSTVEKPSQAHVDHIALAAGERIKGTERHKP